MTSEHKIEKNIQINAEINNDYAEGHLRSSQSPSFTRTPSTIMNEQQLLLTILI